jgi:hypothetical protein
MREAISNFKSFLVVMRNFVSLAMPQVSLMESGHQEPSGQHLLGTSTIGFADVITRNEFGVWEFAKQSKLFS